ncbi:tRNA pseudouridine synthase A [Citrobacter freundii]|uniref:tRNA pseudouridine synthase A n=1 Tax=Citrobacter freundii TaxID=546 RepID=A0A7G2IIQ0_CITFR|nr:tRNA pseudouridine synthase A [Citrobacter freundii]
MPEQVQFWSVADNVRFGGALMAVKIAEKTGAGVPVLMSDQQQPSTHKIALGIEYDGSKYYGWQRQNEVRSVQENWKRRFLRWRTNALMFFVQVARMRAFMALGRSCILKPLPSVKMRPGHWG